MASFQDQRNYLLNELGFFNAMRESLVGQYCSLKCRYVNLPAETKRDNSMNTTADRELCFTQLGRDYAQSDIHRSVDWMHNAPGRVLGVIFALEFEEAAEALAIAREEYLKAEALITNITAALQRCEKVPAMLALQSRLTHVQETRGGLHAVWLSLKRRYLAIDPSVRHNPYMPINVSGLGDVEFVILSPAETHSHKMARHLHNTCCLAHAAMEDGDEKEIEHFVWNAELEAEELEEYLKKIEGVVERYSQMEERALGYPAVQIASNGLDTPVDTPESDRYAGLLQPRFRFGFAGFKCAMQQPPQFVVPPPRPPSPLTQASKLHVQQGGVEDRFVRANQNDYELRITAPTHSTIERWLSGLPD
ncbi:hypothetical protein LTR37_005644 [Vermiconidia calcicola]|uniref:Uncharacterized protein n=1 Tax=Vermiconidia calcicola TaxID=1690605 RepID=A0ACC3NIN2_9PEZI|nr:hypothetical protein LTR37_005644 [Vermiconidia calcicola]